MYLLYIKTVNCSRLTNELSVLSHTVSVGSLQEASHTDDCRWINSTFVIQMFLLFSFTSDLKRCNGPNACVVKLQLIGRHLGSWHFFPYAVKVQQ